MGAMMNDLAQFIGPALLLGMSVSASVFAHWGLKEPPARHSGLLTSTSDSSRAPPAQPKYRIVRRPIYHDYIPSRTAYWAYVRKLLGPFSWWSKLDWYFDESDARKCIEDHKDLPARRERERLRIAAVKDPLVVHEE